MHTFSIHYIHPYIFGEISDKSICENLEKRYRDNWIFTYIGPVLISVNPFKNMSYFTQKEVDMYQGAAQYENPPHIYAIADNMYRHLTTDNENQCVMISGESGAGKTVNAKYILDYINTVSGGGDRSTHVKDVVKYSNPLLEAFGNAKTLRNNNSSRFGKYIEIFFNSGQPAGGEVSNFLLEKSRVVLQNPGERNFHIFYQMVKGSSRDFKDICGISDDLDYYGYLENTESSAPGIDDTKDWNEVLSAMETMNMSREDQLDVISIVSSILHLGNISFSEGQNEVASVYLQDSLDTPSQLLLVDPGSLNQCLVTHIMETNGEVINVSHSVQQAEQTRDALSKALYSRLFDYLVQRINVAMKNSGGTSSMHSLGILDIYGFEIFEKNGFEQFCINFVNEKLQQIFIELTLKNEQEEYKQEGIQWKEINYFNNKVVCNLLESRSPPGIFECIDEISIIYAKVQDKADDNLRNMLRKNFTSNQYFADASNGFIICHYAGEVNYNSAGFIEKNKDILFLDLIKLMKGSASHLVKSLFKEEVEKTRKRPTTAGSKIKTQANELVNKLMLCTPHYVRCIKPNETKQPKDWEVERVMHQVGYLGLTENIRVRKAGFAYRRLFEKFVLRYSILTSETWPPGSYRGDTRGAVEHILRSVNMQRKEYEMGKTKLFIKAPESLFLLEEVRERKFDHFARVIQNKVVGGAPNSPPDIFFKKKERRKHSLNRNFFSDYIGLDNKPELRALVGKREKIEFAQTVDKLDRYFKMTKVDLILTGKNLFLIGREKAKGKNKKDSTVEVMKREIPISQISKISLSSRQDDFVIIHVKDDYSSCLQIRLKSEFVTTLLRTGKEKFAKSIPIQFNDIIDFEVKKGEKRKLSFILGTGDKAILKHGRFLPKEATVEIGRGEPNTSKPRSLDNNNRKGLTGRRGGTGKTGFQGNGQHRGGGRGGEGGGRGGGGGGGVGWVGHGVGGRGGGVSQRGSGFGGRAGFKGNGLQRRDEGSENEYARKPERRSIKMTKRSELARSQARRETSEARRNVDISILSVPKLAAGHIHRQNVKQDEKPALKPKPSNRTLVSRVRVKYDYDAQDQDELTIRVGDIIIVKNEDASGWWTGQLNEKKGFFPADYIEKI
ncbi:unconventional myosin-Ie [Eurytemora carolleeae]|uniref:unconventional myosin-Ie n=1 Tax=Eurytemora carolleeae TaxID=1294199 RepID=UPI000C791959|nr:unconventional myosin-Ie [Eurytemora carolleeae]|eukprot:XP_023342527.1 unconventional myosin-Ie-like [Eurytemora affinis]